MRIPERQHTTANYIDSHIESIEENPRYHLGCSLVGNECWRYIWLVFRFAIKENFSGRMLRLFRRGRLEEDVVVKDMESIGVKINGQQSNINLGCHLSGSCDGVIESGLIEAPSKKHILEIKTHNDKSFKDLCKKGLQESKPIYWTQAQLYMHGSCIDRCYHYNTNKNDDSVYAERVRYDKAFSEKQVKKGHSIALSNRMPEPISNKESFYICKMCSANSFCYSGEPALKNCRTCEYSEPLKNSTWHCHYYNNEIPKYYQAKFCDNYKKHCDL